MKTKTFILVFACGATAGIVTGAAVGFAIGNAHSHTTFEDAVKKESKRRIQKGAEDVIRERRTQAKYNDKFDSIVKESN